MFHQKVCFVKMFVLLKSLLHGKSCFHEKFVSLTKSLFCRKVCFFEKFTSLKSFFRKKVCFVENFVSSKKLFMIDFRQMVTCHVFFGRNQCKFSPWNQICWNFKDPTRIKWVMAIFLCLKRPLQLSQELSVHEDYVNRKKTP